MVNVTPRPLYPRERDPVPIVQEAEWAPGPVWTGAENPPLPGFDPRTVQLVASRYTDYAIPAHSTECRQQHFKIQRLLNTEFYRML
jgi:hypothetical protein